MTQPNNYTLSVDGPLSVELVRQSLRSVIDLLDVEVVEVSLGYEGRNIDVSTRGEDAIEKAAQTLVDLGSGETPQSIIVTIGGDEVVADETPPPEETEQEPAPDVPGRINRPHSVEHLVLHELHFNSPSEDEYLLTDELAERTEHEFLKRHDRVSGAMSRLHEKGLVDAETRTEGFEGSRWRYGYTTTVAGIQELDRLEEPDPEIVKSNLVIPEDPESEESGG